MTALQAGHLDDFTLAALALGDLPATLGAEAREHLHRCGGCQGRFSTVAAEADAHAEGGDHALSFGPEAPRAPVRLLEVARPDGGAVLLFPARTAPGEERAPSGVARVASRVFGRFEQLLHAAAGVPDTIGSLEVAAGEAVHALSGTSGETLEVWFGNPHPIQTWLTVLRQPAGAAGPPLICDGPRALPAGRNAGEPTRLQVSPTEDVVLAVLTADEPPPRDRLQQALAVGWFDVFEQHHPLGQVVCRVVPKQ